MCELRPEHLSMPAWEVSEVSRKYMSLYEPNVTNALLEGGGQCERRESKGHHQGCCDITGSGMEWNVPWSQNICLLTLICSSVTW